MRFPQRLSQLAILGVLLVTSLPAASALPCTQSPACKQVGLTTAIYGSASSPTSDDNGCQVAWTIRLVGAGPNTGGLGWWYDWAVTDHVTGVTSSATNVPGQVDLTITGSGYVGRGQNYVVTAAISVSNFAPPLPLAVIDQASGSAVYSCVIIL